MNEFEILKKYVRSSSQHPVVKGAGDDCSVVDWNERDFLVETTDCLVQDVHFRMPSFNFKELAYKALAVNISDISAMGATPRWAHLNLSLPASVTDRDMESFFKSFYQVADDYNIQLVGGDLTASPGPVFVSLCLSGTVPKDNIKWREGLGSSGVLCVTGALGDSAAGLYCLEKQNLGARWDTLIKSHKMPPIEQKQAQWLSKQRAVLGMMDLSDGLFSDLQRIPHGTIEIDVEKIPYSKNLDELASQEGVSPWQWILCGGEDYRLLINCAETEFESLAKQYEDHFHAKLYPIGRSSSQSSFKMRFLQKGKPFDVRWKPYRHF